MHHRFTALRRHLLLLAAAAWASSAARAETMPLREALRQPGAVLLLRHALAPGTFDPPGFRLGDCSTQRNLSDEGRAQAQRLGPWLREQGAQPAQVRTSPWCRCVDTAQLAFGQAPVWAALGSPVGSRDAAYAERLDELRRALVKARASGAPLAVWVSHMFVIADLAGAGAVGSGEGVVLRAGNDGAPQVLARVSPP